MTIYRIDAWGRFKELATTLKPEFVFYLAEPHPLRKPPLGLRLTFYDRSNMYVFIDYADGKVLHKTGIPVTEAKDDVKAEVREEDVRLFLSAELGKAKLMSLPPFIHLGW